MVNVFGHYNLDTTATTINAEGIFIVTIATFERDDFGTTACATLVTYFDRFLMAHWTKTPFDSIKLFFFFLEIIGVSEYRANQYNK